MSHAERVLAGTLAGTFGLRGELKCMPVRSDETRLVVGGSYALSPTDDAQSVTLTAVRRHHGRWIVALAGVTDQEAARAFVGRELFVDAGSLELAEGEYLDADLVGLRIVDESGTLLGTVGRMHHYPAQDCIVLAEGGALIPMVQAFVRKIDVAAGEITVSLPPGLLDQSAAEEA